MGAPPDDNQLADMLSDPTLAASMQEAMNNPHFVDLMIQSNPMLANLPNAREIINSPQFRRMMTDPDALRMAARMRSTMGGGPGANAFPAPGVTDNTPGGTLGGNNANPFGGNAAQGQAFNPFLGLGGFGGAPGADGGMADFARLFGAGAAPGTTATPASNPTSPPSAPTDSNAQAGAPGATQQTGGAQPNPFAALFGGTAPGAQGAGAGAANQNPFAMPGMPPITPETLQAAMRMFGGAGGQGAAPQIPGMPPITPEMMQQAMQMMQMFGGGGGGAGGFGGFGAPAAAPPDNRPPEEVYAEQLRQLNDMGFFDFDRNVQALRRSGGSVQGAIEHLLNSP